MTPTILIEQPAKEDLTGAVRWYRQLRPGLEEDFLVRAEETLERIKHYPQANPIVTRQLRRALLHRFPYGVFYLDERALIRVVAVLHTSRDPLIWLARSN